MNKNTGIVYSIVITIISIILHFLFISNQEIVGFYKIYLLLTLVINLFIIKNYVGNYSNVFIIFMLFFTIFLISRFILDIFGLRDVEEIDYFNISDITHEELCRIILNLSIAMNSFTIGVLMFRKNKQLYYDKKKLEKINLTNYGIRKIHIFILLILGFTTKFYFAFQMYNEIVNKGYIAFFLGDVDVSRNFIFAFIESFSIIGIFYYLSSIYAKKYISVLIILLYSTLSFSTGQRGPGMIFLVFTLFYYISVQKIKINPLLIIGFGIGIIYLSQLVSSFRYGTEFSAIFLIEDFFWRQGVSLGVLKVSISQYEKFDYSFFDLFGNIRELIDYYYYKLFSYGYEFDRTKLANDYKIFSGYASYLTDRRLYDLGGGLGGSYVGQLYVISKEISQLIGGIFVGYFLSILNYGLFSSNLKTRFLSYIFILSFIYIPRDNLTDFLTDNWIVILAFFSLNWFSQNLNNSFKTKQIE